MIVQNNEDGRERAIEEVRRGNVVAFRTDTFYGLGANPLDAKAVSCLSELKKREGKPILIIISDPEHVARFFVRDSELFQALAARHWAGALTIVELARADLPAELTANTGTIGVRLPDDVEVREFVRLCGGALTATSANVPGLPPARTAEVAANYFPSIKVLDGGAARSNRPSTVLDISQPPTATLVREGAITAEELQETLRTCGAQLKRIAS